MSLCIFISPWSFKSLLAHPYQSSLLAHPFPVVKPAYASFASIRIDVGYQSVRSVIPLFPLQMRPSPPSQGPSAAPLSTSIMFPPPRSAVDSVHFHFDASNLLNIDLCFLFACFFFSPPARTSWKECLILPYWSALFFLTGVPYSSLL